MKKTWSLTLIVFLALLVLVACGKDNPSNEEGDGALIREDETGLVQIRIEEGQASISFDLEKWDDLYGVYEGVYRIFGFHGLEEGPFPIAVKSGKVVDAIVEQVEAIDYSEHEFTPPTVLLMMDDGSLEWLFADPYNSVDLSQVDDWYEDYSIEDRFYSYEKLAHRDDYLSFSYEEEKEGIGEKTIYISNDKGEKFNIYHLMIETILMNGTWATNLEEFDDNWEAKNLYMSLSEDGDMILDIGWGRTYDVVVLDYYENWTGTGEFIRSENHKYPPGSFIFNLNRLWGLDDGDYSSKETIEGAYRLEMQSDGGLSFYHSEGDSFYDREKKDLLYLYNYSDVLEEYRGASFERMAYVDFSRYIHNGAEFIIDWVEWVVDEEEPNDYRIENEYSEYIPFPASIHTECSLMEYDEEGYVDRVYYNLADFIYELENSYRQGRMVAMVQVDDGRISSIHEVYRP